jgi:hypothetical protein
MKVRPPKKCGQFSKEDWEVTGSIETRRDGERDMIMRNRRTGEEKFLGEILDK